MLALEDRVQPVVAIELLDIIVARIAVTAVDLDREAVGFQTILRRPALRDRRQQIEQGDGLLSHHRIGRRALFVDEAGA